MNANPSMEDLRRARITQAIRTLGLELLDLHRSFDDRLVSLVNLKADLTDEERATLLAVVLRTFPADQAEALVRQIFGEAGIPTGGLTKDVLPEARAWAEAANPTELGAYTKAGLEKMSVARLKVIREWIDRRMAE